MCRLAVCPPFRCWNIHIHSVRNDQKDAVHYVHYLKAEGPRDLPAQHDLYSLVLEDITAHLQTLVPLINFYTLVGATSSFVGAGYLPIPHSVFTYGKLI